MASTSHAHVPYAYAMPCLGHNAGRSPVKLPSIDSMASRAPPLPLTVNIDSLPFGTGAIGCQSDPIVVKASPSSTPGLVKKEPLIRLDPTPPPMTSVSVSKLPQSKHSPSSTPPTSPGATSSLSSEQPTSNEGVTPPVSPTDCLPVLPETEFLYSFNYCSDCLKYVQTPETYIAHLLPNHLNPSRLPSHLYEELKNRFERAAVKPYSTFYPSKKRKPNSGRIPRPQNQYMIFSNYVRIPFMKFFNHINHSEISRKISTMWKNLPDSSKQPFKEESKRCEMIHKLEYPHYKYKPKQKKAAVCKKECETPKPSERLHSSPTQPKKIETPKKEPRPVEAPSATRFFDSGAVITYEAGMSGHLPGPDNGYSSYLSSPNNLVLLDKNNSHFSAPSYQLPDVMKEAEFGLGSCAGDQIIFSNSYGSAPTFVEANSSKHLNKRDPILAQNAAPTLSEASGMNWANVFNTSASLMPNQHSPPLSLLPNNMCMGMSGQMLSNDGAVEQLRPTMSAGPSVGDMTGDGQPDLLGFPSLGGQPMEQDVVREVDHNSYDLVEDKHAESFEDFLSLDHIGSPYMLSNI